MTAQMKRNFILESRMSVNIYGLDNFQYIVVQLDPGLKLDTKMGLHTTHHPSQTFRALLGMVGGGDLVC